MTAPQLVPDFSGLRVAVVGDLVADHTLLGQPTRLSREAPVMVLRHRGEELSAGGAANAAVNLRALGAAVSLLGVVGQDANGRALLELLEREGIDVEGVERVRARVTPTKTRVLGAEPGRTRHHVLRIDREPDEPPAPAVRSRVAERLRTLALDAVLLSDYGYGLLGDAVADAARDAKARGLVVVLDPRRFEGAFHGLSAITPNLGELAHAARVESDALADPGALAAAAATLLERLAPEHLLVTLGNRGMALFTPGAAPVAVEAAGHEAVDVSGAGDTAAAAFTLALAAGCDAQRAMRLANAAAGVVVTRPGAVPCPLDQLRSALASAPGAHAVGVLRK